MKNYKNLFNNSILYFINALLTALLGIIVNKIFAIYVDPFEFGTYSVVFGFYNLVVTTVFIILTNSILRYYKEYENNDQLKYLYAATLKILLFIIGLYFVFCVILISILNIFDVNRLYYSLILLFAILFIPEGIRQIGVTFARCQGKVNLQTSANIIDQLIKLIFFLGCFFFIKKSVTAVVVGSIAGTISTLFLFYKCWILPKDFIRVDSKQTSHLLLKFGFPLIGVPIVNYLLTTSDQFIIKLYYGEYDTGLYSMGYKISHAIFSLFTTFLITATHHIIMKKFDDEGREKTESFVKDLSLVYWIICLPLLICVISYSKYIILFLASNKYFDSTFSLIVCSFGMIFGGFINYTNKPWEISKKSWMIALFSGVGALLNLFLNIIFIPKYGYNAAAVTTVVSYLIVIIISSFFGKKFLSVGIHIIDFLKLFIISFITLAISCIFNKYFVDDFISVIIYGMFTVVIFIIFTVILFKSRLINILNSFRKVSD